MALEATDLTLDVVLVLRGRSLSTGATALGATIEASTATVRAATTSLVWLEVAAIPLSQRRWRTTGFHRFSSPLSAHDSLVGCVDGS